MKRTTKAAVLATAAFLAGCGARDESAGRKTSQTDQTAAPRRGGPSPSSSRRMGVRPTSTAR
ncbi:MAG: hypothetical protein ACREMX_12920 [Gemmatimonadales bacterium]